MSKDFQFISVVDRITVFEVADVSGTDVRTISVQAKRGLSQVKRVEINGYGIDTFILVSDTLLLALLGGTPLEKTAVEDMTVSVISGALTGTRDVTLVFSPTSHTLSVDGIQKLIQQVVKEFLSTAGSNRFDPAGGGDVLSALGDTLTPSSKAKISAALARSAQSVQERFLVGQASSVNLSPTERLLSFNLIGLRFLPTHVEADFRLLTRAGQTFNFPLEL